MSTNRAPKVAGCVPAYNNEETVAQAVASLQTQTISLDDIFVVDDGSTDATAQRAKEAGARVVSMGTNQGRGAARARTIEETDAGLLLSVDGTNALAPDFLEKCLPWFEDPRIAAVFGKITQFPPRSAVDRWRGRHLYHMDVQSEATPAKHLASWGFCQRVRTIKSIGNFNPTCRHSEDAEIGQRLLSQGHKIIYDPSAILTTLTSNSLGQVFERYWRWNHGNTTGIQLKGLLRFWWYSIKVLAIDDLRTGDVSCAFLSTLLPYYCFCRSFQHRPR